MKSYLTLISILYSCTLSAQFSAVQLQQLDSLSHVSSHSKVDSVIGIALNEIGILYDAIGEVDSSLHYFEKGLPYLIKSKLDYRIANNYNNLAYIHNRKGNIPQAVELHHKSLQLREHIGDKRGMAESYNNLGIIYYYQGDMENSIKFLESSLSTKRELGEKARIASTLGTLGTIYPAVNQVQKGLEYHLESLSLSQEINDSLSIAYAYNNIGALYRDYGDPTCDNELCKVESATKAIDYFKECLRIMESLGSKPLIAGSHLNIATIYFQNNQLQNALLHANKGYDLATALKIPRYIQKGAKVLSEIWKASGDFQKSLAYFENYITMRDSIKNEETQKAAIRQQTKYEFEKEQLVAEQMRKEALRLQEEKTQRRDNLQYSIIFIAILCVFGLVLALGKIQVSPKVAEGLIFFAFLIFFEFLLVLTDPFIEDFTNGEPMYKLLANALLAGLIFPVHGFFESKLSKKLLNTNY